MNWAFYLGHHWAVRREQGETALTFNYVRAFADFMTNFTFSRGVQFRSPKETEHVVPALLKEVWEDHNHKDKILWEMGNQGGVSGDCFVKVAWEPPAPEMGQLDPRVRILVMNSAFCLTEDTEILTRRGWVTYDQLKMGEDVASRDPDSGKIVWSQVERINVFDWNGPLAKWHNERFDVMSTPDHRWLYRDGRGRESIRRTHQLHELRHNGGRLVVGGGDSDLFADTATYTDEFVRLVGWFVTEGHWHSGTGAPQFTQSSAVYPQHAQEIHSLLEPYEASRYRYEGKADQWYAPKLRDSLHAVVGDDKRFAASFLRELTRPQAEILFETLVKGDGCVSNGTTTWAQSHEGRVDDFQMLCMMLGKRTHARWRQREIGKPCCDVTVYQNDTVNLANLRREEEHYTGKVWCPTTGTGMWIARRKGITFHTGNCFPEWHPHDREKLLRFKLKYRFWGTSPEGTRTVYTFTEICTDDVIEEYINDELIAQRPNPLGVIPYVHIPNVPVSGSPWGLADVQDILTLNRAYNETATDIADIVAYHAAPVTIITGAKASNLEKSARKVWGGLPKDANVFNLQNGVELSGPMEYLQMLKLAMHEMTGVPETALGQVQPISNTSGVALAIQYQPTMSKYHLKRTQYGAGIQAINKLILMTFAYHQPERFEYDPATEGVMQPEYQPPVLDLNDPLTYKSEVHWPPPLPLDALVKLQEISQKMLLGIESKRSALRELGEQFPDEKIQELFDEQVREAKEQGALEMLKQQINSVILQATGMPPTGVEAPMVQADADGNPVNAPGGPGPVSGLTNLTGVNAQEIQQLTAQLVSQAYGANIPLRREPDNNNDD